MLPKVVVRICQGESTTRKRSEEGREDALLVPSSRCAPPSPVEGRGCGGGEGPEQAEAEPEEQCSGF